MRKFAHLIVFIALISFLYSTILLAEEEYAFVTKWGSNGSGNGQFYYPVGVAIDSGGNVYVADSFNQRIQKLTSSGDYITQWGSYGSGDGQFNSPEGIAIDSAGNVYVADYVNHRVQKFTSSGDYITQWGSYGSGDGQFIFPLRIAVDSSGNVYVTDRDNNRVQKFTSTGGYITKWGSYGSGDGQFFYPWGDITLSSSGDVYVTDPYNHRVQVFRIVATTIPAHISFKPDKWTLGWKNSISGKGFVRCYIGSVDGSIDVMDIDISSILLNDVLQPWSLSGQNPPNLILPAFPGFAGKVLVITFQHYGAINALGNVSAGDIVDVTLTGNFISGGGFTGTQSITVIGGALKSPESPIETSLYQNVPNPFNPETWIPYQLGSASTVNINIYDTSGHLVRTLALGNKPAGYYISKDKAAYWDGKNEAGEAVSSGVYFYTIQTGDFTATKKMVITR